MSYRQTDSYWQISWARCHEKTTPRLLTPCEVPTFVRPEPCQNEPGYPAGASAPVYSHDAPAWLFREFARLKSTGRTPFRSMRTYERYMSRWQQRLVDEGLPAILVPDALFQPALLAWQGQHIADVAREIPMWYGTTYMTSRVVTALQAAGIEVQVLPTVEVDMTSVGEELQEMMNDDEEPDQLGMELAELYYSNELPTVRQRHWQLIAVGTTSPVDPFYHPEALNVCDRCGRLTVRVGRPNWEMRRFFGVHRSRRLLVPWYIQSRHLFTVPYLDGFVATEYAKEVFESIDVRGVRYTRLEVGAVFSVCPTRWIGAT